MTILTPLLCLALAIYHECPRCSPMEQAAIAYVAVNRLQNYTVFIGLRTTCDVILRDDGAFPHVPKVGKAGLLKVAGELQRSTNPEVFEAWNTSRIIAQAIGLNLLTDQTHATRFHVDDGQLRPWSVGMQAVRFERFRHVFWRWEVEARDR